MRCRSVLTRIDALRTGELHGPDNAAVEGHIGRCRSCRDSLGDVDELARAVKSLAIAPPKPISIAIAADSFDRIGSGSGTVWVGFSDRGIRLIYRGSQEDFHQHYAKRYGRTLDKRALPEALRKQVENALGGEGVKHPRLDLAEAKPLERKVMEAMLRIPRGEVRSYSWLARQAGIPKAVRAVANYVARNAVPFVVPCHRVVPRSGGVGKYAFGSLLKRELLQREGVDVRLLEDLAQKGIRLIGSKTTGIVCVPTCRDARRIREENRVRFHDEEEALKSGFRPCEHCEPFA